MVGFNLNKFGNFNRREVVGRRSALLVDETNIIIFCEICHPLSILLARLHLPVLCHILIFCLFVSRNLTLNVGLPSCPTTQTTL